jgi:hypothetical protein
MNFDIIPQIMQRFLNLVVFISESANSIKIREDDRIMKKFVILSLMAVILLSIDAPSAYADDSFETAVPITD